MKFCKQCDNMLYFKIEESKKEDEDKEEKKKTLLYYYCRKCGDKELIKQTELIKDITYEKKQIDDIVNINKNIKYDPTIPHVKNMNCPNSECITNKTTMEQDIIYYRYNEEDIKYLYMCVYCDTTWKPEAETKKLI